MPSLIMPPSEAAPSSQIGSLYASHHSWLQSLLRRRLGDAADAADLAHDAFLRLIEKPRQFDSNEGARNYLSTVAKGLCIDLWRRRELERAWLDALAAQPAAVAPSPEHQTIILQTLCQIDAMLQSLSAKMARAFVLAMIHGMTDQQIAQELSVSDRMVRKYMAKAMLHCLEFEAAHELHATS